jgi:glycosyltransferase involved in cell wall biosynthesis
MRILFLQQWFEPEPTFKGMAFARQLMKQGHEVEVLTGFPNYPDGKLYAGYRLRWRQRETINGVSIIRVPLYPNHDASSLRRVLNYVSFAVSAAVLGPFLVRKADVVYVYHPPGTVALPAMALKILRGMPFVLDINDLWPDSLPATGMLTNRPILRCVDLWCRLAYRAASRIVIGSPGAKKILQERGVPGEKVSLIHNWVDEDKVTMAAQDGFAAREPQMAGRFNVVFAGNMGRAQALDAVLDAAALVRGRLPTVQFLFIGGGIDVERLKDKAEEMGLANVLFLPRRPMSEIGSVLSAADILLVHLRDDPLFEVTLPSKTQAYLAAGRPILMAVRGDAAQLVEASGGGISCVPQDAESIATAVERLVKMSSEERDDMGRRGAEYYRNELSLRIGSQRFEQIFERVANSLEVSAT